MKTYAGNYALQEKLVLPIVELRR